MQQQNPLDSHKVYNLQKHTSYVFTSTIHTVILYWNLNKYKAINPQISEQNQNNWNQYKKTIEFTQAKYIATGGADKFIYLWQVDTIDKPDSYKNAKSVDQPRLQAEDHAQEQQEFKFTEQQLNFGHFIVQPQQNLYQFITCLISVEVNNQSFLIAGYESNQIIKYEMHGEFWRTNSGSQKHLLTGNSAISLQSHNDSVRSLLYCNDELFSCGDDLQLLVQDLRGVVLRKYYFDGIIEKLYCKGDKQNKQILFMFHSTQQEPFEKKVIEKRQQQQIFGTGKIQQEAQQEIDVEVTVQTYQFKVVQNIMILDHRNQNLNQRMQITNNNQFQEDLSVALKQVEEITCAIVEEGKDQEKSHIILGTKLGRIYKVPIENQTGDEKNEKYIIQENMQYSEKTYQYHFKEKTNLQLMIDLSCQIMSITQIGNTYYLTCKDNNDLTKTSLKKLNSSLNLDSSVNLDIFYILNEQPTQFIDSEKQGPKYEVFLQHPLHIVDKSIILYCVEIYQIMNKKKIKRTDLQSAPEIIRTRHKPGNHLEIECLVMEDMRKKILNDEMNTIQFYDIVQPDQDEMITSLKDSTKKPVKLHKRVRRTDLENKLRNRLADEPGARLLLQEIYEKLEEDPGNSLTVRKKLHQEEQFKANQQYKPESDDQLVANLDTWYKGIKKRWKEEQEKLKQEQEKERLAKLQQQERNQSLQMQRRGGLNDRNKAQQAMPAFPKLIVESAKSEGDSSTFKQKLMGSLQKISAVKKLEMLHQDHSLVKQLDKYMQQGSTLTQQELVQIELARAKQQGEDKQDTLIFDYTVEGLKNSLHTLIKMQLTSFQNASDRAVFYEKQTNQILITINQRLERQRNTVKKNEKDLETLRMENHEIHKKLRQIQDFIKERQEELRSINRKPQQSTNSPQIKNNASQVDNYMLIAVKQNELENQIDQMRDNYNKFQQQMKLNSIQIEKLEAENSKLNKNNKALLKAIQGFLLELLKIGLDCRSQGLSWIIKAVWDSGEKISDQNFPPYLDSKARDFLINKTRRTIELNDLFKKAHLLFSNYRDSSLDTGNNSIVSLLSKNHFSQIDSIEIKKTHIDQIKSRQENEVALLIDGLSPVENSLIQKTLTQIFQSKETLNDIIYNEAQRRIAKMFKSEGAQEQSIVFTEINNFEKDRLIKEYQQIQKDIETKENQFKKFEESELQRLVKEIDYKNYLARFNVEALQVLAALFGYSRAERELIKYGMVHKMLNN